MNKKDQNIIVRERLITQKDVVFTCGIKDVLGRIHKTTGKIKYSDIKFVD
jgi:hypothetical protein